MTSIDHSNDSNTDSPFEINSRNYKNGIPQGVVNVILSEDLHPSLYNEIFKSGVFSKSEDQLLNVILPHSMTEIPDKAFYYIARDEDRDTNSFDFI